MQIQEETMLLVCKAGIDVGCTDIHQHLLQEILRNTYNINVCPVAVKSKGMTWEWVCHVNDNIASEPVGEMYRCRFDSYEYALELGLHMGVSCIIDLNKLMGKCSSKVEFLTNEE